MLTVIGQRVLAIIVVAVYVVSAFHGHDAHGPGVMHTISNLGTLTAWACAVIILHNWRYGRNVSE